MAGSDLGRRLVVAALAIPVVVAAVYIGGWVMGVVLAAAAAVGAVELCRMAEQRGVQPFTLAAAALAALLVLLATALPTPEAAAPWLWLTMLLATLVLGAAAIWLRGTAGAPLGAVAVTLLAALLLGGTLSYAMFLRYLPHGLPSAPGPDTAAAIAGAETRLAGALLVGFPLILTWISDTAAYFGGRAFGRRKLIPSISPAKTVAGAVAGVLGTIAVGAFYGWLAEAVAGLPIGWLAGATGGALVSIVAQLGDLVESLLKREAGVKDSGSLFPGHGGLLDRVDSLLFAFPAAFWYLSAVL